MKERHQPFHSTMDDLYNRHINYLRISVTDRCNLRCVYCRPSGRIAKLSHDDILRYEEILRIIHIMAEMGLVKIRITGGEPLVRKGLVPFLQKITAVSGIQDVSLTTNAVLLSNYVQDIYNTGIRRLNISLDSLHRSTYKAITGSDSFNRVWAGIQDALSAGFDPIKINFVALRGINDHEIETFARLSYTYPFHVRFIEQMPIGDTAFRVEDPLLSDEIKYILESSVGKLIPVENGILDGPAKRYKFGGFKGEIGIISPISHHFCETCNRLRLTSNGLLRPCLLSDYSEDLKTPLRSGCSDDHLARIIIKAIKNKPAKHALVSETPAEVISPMSSIGG
ncbi:MAG: GTP 3',8-cyclase MoaA [Desulfobacterales bacterium]